MFLIQAHKLNQEHYQSGLERDRPLNGYSLSQNYRIPGSAPGETDNSGIAFSLGFNLNRTYRSSSG